MKINERKKKGKKKKMKNSQKTKLAQN